MDEDWEADDFVPVAPALAKEQPKSMWEDEDVEEEDVKESWEDEDNPAPESKPVKETTVRPEKDAAESKGKSAESKGKSAKVQDERLADPLSEKLRQQRLVEEADYQSTTELFGKREGEKSLDNFIPKSEEDFLEYAELIAHKLKPFEKSFHYLTLLKAVMRHAMATMKAADAKEIASTATIIANEKIRAEKDATAGKKKAGGAKKKQLHVDRPDDDALVGAYEDINDYDFM